MRANTYILVLFILSKYSVIFTNGSVIAKYGPFKIKTLSAYPCKKPTRPIDKDTFIYFHTEIYNSSQTNNLMRGNATILKENRNIKMRTKRHIWENGKWNIVFIMNNIGCQGLFLEVLFAGVGVKIDKEKCGLVQGSYAFNDLDPNKQLHSWLSEMEYGKILWKFEIFSQAGSAFCWEFESIVSPKTK